MKQTERNWVSIIQVSTLGLTVLVLIDLGFHAFTGRIEQNAAHVFWVGLLTLLQLVIVVVLFVQRAKRKRTERSLEESQQRYRTIIETADEGIWLFGPDWRVRFANARIGAMLGTVPEGMVGKPLSEFMHPSSATVVQQVMVGCERGERGQHEFRLLRADGASLSTFISCSSLQTKRGEFDGAIAMVTDHSAWRESEQWLSRERSMFLNGPAVAWRWRNDQGWPVEYVSANISTLGYTPEQFTTGEVRFADIVHPDDLPRIGAEVREHVANRSLGFEQTYRLRDAQGRWRWIDDRTVVNYDDHGHATHFLGYTIDSTDHVQAEQRVRESEDMLLRERSLFLKGPAIAWRWRNVEGCPVEYVSANVSSLGYTPEQFTRGEVKFDDIVHPEDFVRMSDEVDRNVTLGVQGFEQFYRVRDASGRWRWMEDRTVIEYDALGHATYFVGYTVDSTERIEAERMRQLSEQRQRLLVQSMPLGVIYFNPDFTIAEWNPAAERIFGYAADEAIGQHAMILVPAQSREYVQDVLTHLSRQTGGFRGTNWNARKDGSLILCEWYNTPLLDEHGKLTAFACVCEDVTERHEAERRQELLVTELDHRVKNNLASVMSLADQTGRTAENYEEFLATFSGRLRAMSRMHNALAKSGWQGVDLAELLRQSFEAFCAGEPSRVELVGPSVVLSPRASQVLAITFNELCTNAAKYGALSSPEGRIRVDWNIADQAIGLELNWVETGGPIIEALTPRKRGLGSALIEGAVAHELRGTVSLRFPASGVECQIRAPLELAIITPDLTGAERKTAPHA